MIPDLRSWIPYRADMHAAVPTLHWCHTGGQRLTRPFFDEDVTDRLRLPFNRTFAATTTFDEAGIHLRRYPPLAPTAFIFHIGRCGSTLVAQMLAADARNRVLSEPAPFDAVIRAPLVRSVDRATYTAWLHTMLGALGQPSPGEDRLFVKLDCWTTAAATELDLAFPDVPWLFLVRDPVEVLVSMLAHQPITLLPAVIPPGLFGVSLEEAITMGDVRYGARVLGFLLDQMAAWAPRAHIIAYPDLPDALWPWLANIGIDPDDETRALMHERTSRHGKFPEQAFHGDGAVKRAAASPSVRDAVDELARPAFKSVLAATMGASPRSVPRHAG